MMTDVTESWVAGLPKIELHVHVEGAILPETLMKLAQKNKVDLPPKTLAEFRDWYRFTDFPHFAEVYWAFSKAIQSEEDIYQVALDFPELRIVGGHIGWPWTEEAIAVAWKHANVWIDTSAHVPKHFPPTFTYFMRTFGQDKCLFASDWPLLPLARPLRELDEHCALPEPVRQKFLRENAARAFKLEL